ncbi:hypothetical protein GCM10007216_21230 [Thalassobacillus devorans]|uniref:Uncharacterized protein n=1 Tax=Thalassobacillus devorans TaxID=279813 RepID=A0ABQ1P3G2_9BACI|nr:hypothetical protein [Thalassobacillus devorans]NIK27934.1 hypothetical protein [Thalassobacillus devorans]GGC90200.1 hypothetical protein GCM10007216_21230 [Thalassobacillus devorans]
MAGNLLWNLALAISGFFLSLLLSLQNNSLDTSMIRAAFVFVCLYLLGYFFRWAFQFIKGEKTKLAVVNKDINDPLPINKDDVEEVQLSAQATEAVRQLLKED